MIIKDILEFRIVRQMDRYLEDFKNRFLCMLNFLYKQPCTQFIEEFFSCFALVSPSFLLSLRKLLEYLTSYHLKFTSCSHLKFLTFLLVLHYLKNGPWCSITV